MQTARLFWNGRSQAVRLPREFRFSGTEVWVKRVGSAVLLVPLDNPWQPLFDSLGQFSPDFMADRRQPVTTDRREEL